VIGTYLGSEVKLTVALVIIVTVLVLKPSGLFGSRQVARV
jgi:branched-chain amino acid transport system permease protein